MKKILTLAIAAATVGCAAVDSSGGESRHLTERTAVHTGEMGFPEFVQPVIKGAPTLSDPMLVMGASKPVLTEKHGLVSPAMWDWDGDGKRDLLLGEFETGDAKLGDKASCIRVYKNVGSDRNPQFTDEFQYARDTEGDPILVHQW